MRVGDTQQNRPGQGVRQLGESWPVLDPQIDRLEFKQSIPSLLFDIVTVFGKPFCTLRFTLFPSVQVGLLLSILFTHFSQSFNPNRWPDMQSFLKLALVGILASAADARRCKHRHSHHSAPTAVPTAGSLTTIDVETPTAGLPSSSAEAIPTTASSSVVVIPTVESSLASESSVQEPTSVVEPTSAQEPTSVQVSTSVQETTSVEEPTSVQAPTSVQEPTTSSASSITEPSSSSVAVEPSSASSTVPSSTPVVNAPASADMCADDQKTLLDEWGLLVSNGRVVESTVEGTVCTTYNNVVTLADGQVAVEFTADANLVFDEATMNDNKYYSNMAVTKNVDEKLGDIASIPSSYTWSRTNTSDFRGMSRPIYHDEMRPRLTKFRKCLLRPGPSP